MLWGGEPIYRDTEPVGYTTSGSYGHTVGAPSRWVTFNNPAGVDADFVRSGRYKINVNGERIPAAAYLQAPYDPNRERILA